MGRATIKAKRPDMSPQSGMSHKHWNLKLGVDDRRGIGSHGIKGGVPEIEEARMADNQIETESKNGIDTDVIENIDPVGIEKWRQKEEAAGERSGDDGFGVAHTFSATRSPRRPVGRTIRIKISTQKAMASFHAMER